MKRICQRCHKKREHHAKGFCLDCYRTLFRKEYLSRKRKRYYEKHRDYWPKRRRTLATNGTDPTN